MAPLAGFLRLQHRVRHAFPLRGRCRGYFGPGQTVTFRIMDQILREPSGKVRAAVLVQL